MWLVISQELQLPASEVTMPLGKWDFRVNFGSSTTTDCTTTVLFSRSTYCRVLSLSPLQWHPCLEPVNRLSLWWVLSVELHWSSKGETTHRLSSQRMGCTSETRPGRWRWETSCAVMGTSLSRERHEIFSTKRSTADVLSPVRTTLTFWPEELWANKLILF